MLRRVALLCVLAAAYAAPAVAQPADAGADKPSAKPVVAVLPLTATSRRMAIYSAPVADAIAKELGGAGGFSVEAPDLGEAIPARVDLVVDGRIVTDPSGVFLEMRVRDPALGRSVAHLRGGPKSLAQIDALAAETGRALIAEVTAALSAQRAARRRARSSALPEAVVSGTSARETSSEYERRPPMVVFEATGKSAHPDVPVAGAATRMANWVAYQLGFRPVSRKPAGIVPPDEAVAALRAADARYGLMIHVYDVRFPWLGVLGARSVFRVVVVEPSGRAIYDEIHRTDTVVGSRGDGREALLGFAMAQAADIVIPPLRRLLAK